VPELVPPTAAAKPNDDLSLDSYSRTVAAVADALGPSVVAVMAGDAGIGSGVVISPDGLIVR
jgi:hypothetical protein